jgi:hypothetical protein
MEASQFSLKGMLLATAWFALAVFVFAQDYRFIERNSCMTGRPGWELGVPVAIAGVAALFSRWRVMAIVGLPTAVWVVLRTIGVPYL